MISSTKLPTRAALIIFVFTLVFGSEAYPSARGQEVAADDESGIYILDVASLSAAAIDAVCALPAVEGWLELGNTLIITSDKRFEVALAEVAPTVPCTVYPGTRGALRLARTESPHANELLRQEAQILFGLGRYAVISVTADAADRLCYGSNQQIKLEPVPWNSALIQRSDRVYSPAAKTASSPIVSAAVEAFDLDKYTHVVTDLVNFGTRYTLTNSFPDVTDYLSDEFQALGYTVTFDPFPISGKTRRNVIAEITGDVTPENVYIVCGHCDCTSQNPQTNAPGADDNASGAGAVIEMARVLKPYRFDSTIRFICFSGEEQGLVGSYAYVNDLINSGQLGNVKGVINMDMIGYLNTPVWDVLLEGGSGVSQQYLSLLSSLVPQYTTLTSFVSTNPYGSDHIPFINNGVNAVLTIEYEDWYNPNYHSTNDKMRTLTMPFAGEIVKLNIAATAIQAGIKGGHLFTKSLPFWETKVD